MRGLVAGVGRPGCAPARLNVELLPRHRQRGDGRKHSQTEQKCELADCFHGLNSADKAESLVFSFGGKHPHPERAVKPLRCASGLLATAGVNRRQPKDPSWGKPTAGAKPVHTPANFRNPPSVKTAARGEESKNSTLEVGRKHLSPSRRRAAPATPIHRRHPLVTPTPSSHLRRWLTLPIRRMKPAHGAADLRLGCRPGELSGLSPCSRLR